MSEPVDDERARLMAAFASVVERAGDACPDAARMWSAVGGRLPPADTREIVNHVASCGACTEAWLIARELAEDADAARARHLPPPMWRRWPGLAAAAVVVLSIAIYGVLARRTSVPDGSTYREAGVPVVRSLVDEGRAVSRNNLLLKWTPGPPGSQYAVQVATDDLTPIARSRGLTKPEYVVPESSLARVPAGARLLWQVEVGLPDGSKQMSATFIVTVN